MNPVIAALVLLAQLPNEPTTKIVGETKVPAYGLVRLTADVLPAKAAVRWRVNPSKGVERATTARERLEFTAPPGEYAVELLVIGTGPDGAVFLSEVFATVTIAAPPGVQPPGGGPGGGGPGGKAVTDAALGKLFVGNSMCTATVIGPRRADGRWLLLTAAHCTGGVGSRGTFELQDGREVRCSIKVRSESGDLAVLLTDSATLGDLPYALMADDEPAPGTKVWQAGYGWNQPRVRKDGEVIGGPNSNWQLRFNLSVSNGDSGGPIFDAKTGRVLAAVCCTARIASKASMHGGGVTLARKMLAMVGGEQGVEGEENRDDEPRIHPIQLLN
jgi:hypothetical protein